MDLVFVGPPLFLSTIATVMPGAQTEPGPVEKLARDDTAFVCAMDPAGTLLDPVYDSNAMFRGVQTNLRKTVQGIGHSDDEQEPQMPMSSALAVSVWGSAWVIGSVTGNYAFRERGFAASDAFLAVYLTACSIPGLKRLVCPPLCVRVGRLSYQASAAQIAKAFRDAVAMPKQPTAVTTSDSRGVQCYITMFNDSV